MSNRLPHFFEPPKRRGAPTATLNKRSGSNGADPTMSRFVLIDAMPITPLAAQRLPDIPLGDRVAHRHQNRPDCRRAPQAHHT